MTWLDELSEGVLAKLSTEEDRSAGLDDIARAVAILESAVARHESETVEAGRAAALKAAADPSYSFVEKPVLAPLAMAHWDAAWTFPQIMRSAFFMAAYSHLEAMLLSWCECVERSEARPLCVAPLREFDRKAGRQPILRRLVRFLNVALLLASDDFETWPEWRRVDDHRLVRNCLTHRGGILDPSDPDDFAREEAAARALPQIEVDDSGLLNQEPRVNVLPGACEAAIEAAKAFLERLHAAAGL